VTRTRAAAVTETVIAVRALITLINHQFVARNVNAAMEKYFEVANLTYSYLSRNMAAAYQELCFRIFFIILRSKNRMYT
jgi:hypothetical protein